MTAASHRTAESGFTLIELVVAIILMSIMAAALTTVLVGAFNSSGRSSARAKAQRAAVGATNLMQDDLRAAHAKDRNPVNVRNQDTLRDMLMFDGAAPNVDIHDVTAASGTSFTIEADLTSSPGPECVTWYVAADTSVRRAVGPYRAGCAGAPAGGTEQVVIPAMPTKPPGGIPKLFSYQLLVQPRIVRNMDPGDCTSQVLTTPAGNLSKLQRDQITGVKLDPSSFVVRSLVHGQQELVSFASITSRQSSEYRYGLGCVS